MGTSRTPGAGAVRKKQQGCCRDGAGPIFFIFHTTEAREVRISALRLLSLKFVKFLLLAPLVLAVLTGGTSLADNNYLKAQQGPYRLSDIPEDMATAPILDPALEEQSLSFAITMDYRCSAPATAQTAIVSVADSTAAIEPGEATGQQGLTIAVPRSQLVGLNPDQACPADLDPSPESEPDRPWALQHVPGAFAAYATLVCADEATGSTATGTAAVPLDVWVRCPVGAPKADDRDSRELALAEELAEGAAPEPVD